MPSAPIRSVDALVLGAGAAGLFCGAQAGFRGLDVLVLDHSEKPAEKVRISGGGRCNFTNLHTSADRFLSTNPHFAKSALARYTPEDFCGLLRRHGITWHEKTLGQLFCDGRSQAVIEMLLDELSGAGGELALGVRIDRVDALAGGGYRVETSIGPITAQRLVVATGGLSIPKMGATGLAYEIARRFGLAVIEPRPALVPLTFSGADRDAFATLSGVSCPVRASAGGAAFDEAMLFTHRGLSGPAILQVSSYWKPGEPVEIDLLADADALTDLKEARAAHPKRSLGGALESRLPKRLVDLLCERGVAPAEARLADLSNERLAAVTRALSAWRLKPTGTEGWRTAEVTAGGVDTAELSSKTMAAKRAPGLYFIGECVDVTGWLGGYNFQWAWASAFAAAEAMAA